MFIGISEHAVKGTVFQDLNLFQLRANVELLLSSDLAV
jgi:hypothetical protein